jgi:eukaryotic-like serine/threonine-protein kinase
MRRAPVAAGEEIAPGLEVIEHLRRGRALDVYDVWSEERAARVVVKALRADCRDRDRARRRLLEEGRMLCTLTHPHIVRGYETLEAPVPLVVMETLTGETLGHLVAAGEQELSVEEVGHLGLHLASAVRYLHAHGYLHLDLKPSNVIAESGRAKLIDLSVARPPGYAHPGIGTWLYMAPEQARGGALGPAADVWGIGAVLFEAATGEPAFEDPGEPRDESGVRASADGYLESTGSDETEELAYPQLQYRAGRVEELRTVPAELGDLVAACLEPVAARRPTVEELLAALEPLAGLPAEERRFGRARAAKPPAPSARSAAVPAGTG